MKVAAGALALIVLAGCGSTPEPEPVIVPQRLEAKPDPRVDELQLVIAELVDRLEVMNTRMKRLESDLEEARSMPPQAAPRTTTPSPRSASGATAAVAVPSRSGTIPDRYRAALELFGRGRHEEARKGFQEVFDREPGGDLADNALYWIGETYFAAGEYYDAIRYYGRIDEEYSDQNKAPDALLKTGLAWVRIGDLGMARRAFEGVIARYPYSTPANAARAELKRIQY